MSAIYRPYIQKLGKAGPSFDRSKSITEQCNKWRWTELHPQAFQILDDHQYAKIRNNSYGPDFMVYIDNIPFLYVLAASKLYATEHNLRAAFTSFTFAIKNRSGKFDVDELFQLPTIFLFSKLFVMQLHKIILSDVDSLTLSPDIILEYLYLRCRRIGEIVEWSIYVR